jgi:hypothetical protein
VSDDLTPELAATIADAFARRDRDNMQPAIDFFEELLTPTLINLAGRPSPGRGTEGDRLVNAP